VKLALRALTLAAAAVIVFYAGLVVGTDHPPEPNSVGPLVPVPSESVTTSGRYVVATTITVPSHTDRLVQASAIAALVAAAFLLVRGTVVVVRRVRR
jgi:hypothetical protein